MCESLETAVFRRRSLMLVAAMRSRTIFAGFVIVDGLQAAFVAPSTARYWDKQRDGAVRSASLFSFIWQDHAPPTRRGALRRPAIYAASLVGFQCYPMRSSMVGLALAPTSRASIASLSLWSDHLVGHVAVVRNTLPTDASGVVEREDVLVSGPDRRQDVGQLSGPFTVPLLPSLTDTGSPPQGVLHRRRMTESSERRRFR